MRSTTQPHKPVCQPAAQQVGQPADNRQRGIALVITLILLSVITFMAVTFLVVSRHEGEQVDTTTQQNVAKFAAEGIAQQAIGQITALMLGTTNGYNQPLLVSTNYISPGGYNPRPQVAANLNNVSYNIAQGSVWTPQFQQQMLNNLQYLPRAPVFVTTNKNSPPDFRFYHDLNGNGIDDSNGVWNESVNGVLVQPQNSYTGDPEWIGFLEHPDQRHSASNQFLARGAFIALPIGNSLDLNFIHNQAKFLGSLGGGLGNSGDAFFRNQGVAPWEMNLAAFLVTLNTNQWGVNSPGFVYKYVSQAPPSQGRAFDEAASIVQYRYNGSYTTLNSAQLMYQSQYALASAYFNNGLVDGYTIGPLLTTVSLGPPVNYQPYTVQSWSGADNPVQFFRPRDLYTAPIPNSITHSFTNDFYQSGMLYNNNTGGNLPDITNSYNRTTLYRLLSQMSFGSAPEPAPYPVGGGYQYSWTGPYAKIPAGVTNIGGRNQMSYGSVPEAYPYPHGRKMNLNFDNIHYNTTNFVPWTPAGFFTNAADRMLRTYFPTNFALMTPGGPMVTNLNIGFIPIYPVNFYTPAVHRVLQLAANMYDASTNKTALYGFDAPSVFKPYFGARGSGANMVIYIAGYGEQTAPTSADSFWNAPLDLRRPLDLSRLLVDIGSGVDTNDNVYGIPYVIGARPNLPNVNQFSMAPVVQITRAMQMNWTNKVLFTNISYVIGISNVVGIQCWNSSTNYFNRMPQGIRILASDDYSVLVTNTYLGTPVPINGTFVLQPQYPLQINPWPNGISPVNSSVYNSASYAVPMLTNAIALAANSSLLRNGNYSTNGSVFIPFAATPLTGSFMPDWGVNITNRVRVVIQDIATQRIIDCVQLGGLGQLAGPDSQDCLITNMAAMSTPAGANVNLWSSNGVTTNNPLPVGIYNQIRISEGFVNVPQSMWQNSPNGTSPGSIQAATSKFYTFMTTPSMAGSQQAPFVVSMIFKKVYTWSANDPLVHYTVGDLTDLTKQGSANIPILLQTSNQVNNILTNLNSFSTRYFPWPNVPTDANQQNFNSDHLEYSDSLVTSSSAWLYPSNKYPSVGWLGRVHRGTPWQTVYLKPHSATFNNGAWQEWTGNANPNDALTTQPANDWQLLDLFTTAANDNAGRGQLSVNQPGAAAWAAALDGVTVLSNSPTAAPSYLSLDTSVPNGFGQQIISAINQTRSSPPYNGVFTSIGQALSTAALTTSSPYLNLANPGNINDAEYEWIPQQIASLLRVGTPRYVIFGYGQALKPANNSLVQSGQFFGMPTNYQITGEVLTRTVVRFDNFPVPGQRTQPGSWDVYALPVLGQNSYVVVSNYVPPVKAVVESFAVLGPDQ